MGLLLDCFRDVMKEKPPERSNLIELMKALKVGDNELSAQTGLPPTTIYRMKVGTTDPRLSTMKALADFFQVTLGQIVNEEPLPADFLELNDKVNKNNTFFKIPVLGWEQASVWKEGALQQYTEWTYTDVVQSEKAFALKIRSDEYGLRFPKGGVILVEDVLPESYPYYAVIFNLASQECSIVKVMQAASVVYLVHPENQAISFPLDAEKHQIVGVILGVNCRL